MRHIAVESYLSTTALNANCVGEERRQPVQHTESWRHAPPGAAFSGCFGNARFRVSATDAQGRIARAILNGRAGGNDFRRCRI